jgi:hypothetical protein
MGAQIGTLESWTVQSPQEIGVEVEFHFQYTDPDGNTQYFTSKRWDSEDNDPANVTLTWAKYGDSSINPVMIESSLKCIQITGIGTKETAYNTGSAIFSNQYEAGNAPLIKNVQIVIPHGIYNKSGFAKTMSDLMQSSLRLFDQTPIESGSNFLLRADDPQFDPTGTGKALYFTKAGTRPDTAGTTAYQYKTSNSNVLTPYWIGASQVALIWDDDTSQFAWQFIHTPYASANQMAVAVIEDTTTHKYSTVTEACGIYFTSLQPITLWQDTLGFDLNSLICVNDVNPTDPTKSCISREQLIAKTTHGFFSLQSLFANFDRKIGTTTITAETTDTLMLKAHNIYSNASSGGFFLVEVTFTGKKFYYFGDKVNGSISAIVSNYSLQDNYVTGYADSSINYIHQGAPFNLNNFSVRILDANTKQPIKSLGENSFVFIQVDKNILGIQPIVKSLKPHNK